MITHTGDCSKHTKDRRNAVFLCLRIYGTIDAMKTAIRMDDITPDMDYEKFNRVKVILDDADLRPLIGVVPYSKDDTLRIEKPHEDFDELVRDLEKKGWIIALHGYNHLYTTKDKGMFPINEFSEFAGVDYDKQEVMIRQGLSQLREWGMNPIMFMAPGHTFDKNTLKALKVNGINRITDGFGNSPYIRDGIMFYPISSRRKDCISDKEGYSTYVLHTNTMSDEGIEAFKKMLNENRDKFISFDEYLNVKPIERSIFGNIREYLMATAKHYLVSKKASKGTVIHKQ